MRSRSSRIAYRPDVDGLRAIAVLAVVGFHASPRFIPGGFVGVDVFFVISGFLISSIVFAQLDRGTFTFADFYTRRIRRIFPALLVVLVACWALGWFVLVDNEYRALLKHIAGGSLFVSNIVLWGEAGYFDVASSMKPLLHLWSLGIEEQFYLLWPPLLYVCWKRGLNIVSVIIAVIVFSFVLNISLVTSNAVSAFYLPSSRMWQLLLGGLLAYAEFFRKEQTNAAVTRMVFASPDRADPRLVANLKASIGLCLIVLAILILSQSLDFPGWWFSTQTSRELAAFVGLDEGTAYPGWWAVLPTLGTALLIWAGSEAWINRVMLSRRWLVYLGLMSYPLYLWHWPLLAFLEITESGAPSRALKAWAVGLSFLLAWLTYRFVEQPIRRGITVRTPFRIGALTASLVLVGLVSFYGYAATAFSSRVPRFATAVDARLVSPRHDPSCSKQFPTSAEYCQQYAPDLKVTTVLMGDSHAEHFLNGVGAHLARKGENVVHLGESGCPPLLGIERVHRGGRDTCLDASRSVIDYVVSNPDLTRVILSFRGTFEINGIDAGEPATADKTIYRMAGTNLTPAESIQEGLERTVDALLQRSKSVWLLLDVPEFTFDITECAGRPFSFEGRIRTPCAVPTSSVMDRQSAYRQVVASVQRKIPALKVFDPSPFLCDERWCFALINDTLLYLDRNHLSRAGSLFFADKFPF